MPRAPRQHGTLAMRRRGECQVDPCSACLKAGRDYEKLRSYRVATGRPSLVDAGPARSHAFLLRSLGMGNHDIALATGGAVDRTQVRALLDGQNGRTSRRIRPGTAAAILAVPMPEQCPAPRPSRRVLDGTGTARRMQALLADGYRPTYLAQRLGVSLPNLGHLYETTAVNRSTRDKVAALYDELEHTPGPRDPRSAARYQARGYLSAGWWDAETIDDPLHLPDTHERESDLEHRTVTREQRILDLLTAGHTVRDVAHTLLRERLADRARSVESVMRTVERDKQRLRSQGLLDAA